MHTCESRRSMENDSVVIYISLWTSQEVTVPSGRTQYGRTVAVKKSPVYSSPVLLRVSVGFFLVLYSSFL